MNDPLRGRSQGHMTYFLNFGTPSVTFEWVNASNFPQVDYTTNASNSQHISLPQKGSKGITWPTFLSLKYFPL